MENKNGKILVVKLVLFLDTTHKYQSSFIPSYYMKHNGTRVIHIGGIVPFLLTGSWVQLRHWVMNQDHMPPVLSHSSTSVTQGQTEDSFTLALHYTNTPQFSSFPGKRSRFF